MQYEDNTENKYKDLKVSVAMTTYNGEKYILEQLDSIKNQSRNVDEVVIYDDCSTDNTAQITAEYIKENSLKQWRLYINEVNVGYKENFYRAVKEADGDIIFLCDQDDIWHEKKIEEVSVLFMSDENIKAVNTGFIMIDSGGKPITAVNRKNRSNSNLIIGKMKADEFRKFDTDYIVWRNISPGCTAAFTKEIKKFFVKNYTRLCPHDWEINIYAAIRDGLYFLNKELVYYRQHEKNTIGIKSVSLKNRFSRVNMEEMLERTENEQKRAKAFINAAWQNELSDTDKEVFINYDKITEKHYNLLRTKGIFSFIYLCYRFSEYIKLMGPQGIINDFKVLFQKRD